MEPVVNKLQEGVKYPRFERDATKTINDLVEHITKERGIYSSSIEPNPSEHSIWFNTSNNTIMIYNNGAWRNFSGDSSGKTKIIVNPKKEENYSNNEVIYTINDNAFYIITDDYRNTINIKNADDYDFWLYIEKMPYTITFSNATVITNVGDIYNKYGEDLDYSIILAHKIGNVVEFTVIWMADVYKYKYFTKRNVFIIYVNTNGKLDKIIRNTEGGVDSLLKYVNVYASNSSSEYPYDKSIFVSGAAVQLLYPPYHYPLDYDSLYNDTQLNAMLKQIPKCLVINGLSSENYKNPFSIHNSDIKYIIEENYMTADINTYKRYPYFPQTLVLNADVEFEDPFSESAIIRLPIRSANHNLIIKKPSIFAGINCDQHIDYTEENSFKDLIIEDFGVSNTAMLIYNSDFGNFGVKNVYLMGGKPEKIVNDIFREEIKIYDSLIYGSNYNGKIFTFECDGSGMSYVVIACKLNKDNFTIYGNTLEDNDIIFTLQENIDILESRGVNPRNGFKIITVNTVKDNDGFIVSESYGLTEYGINDFTRFEVPLVSY